MDANGGHSKAIARSLKKLGVKASTKQFVSKVFSLSSDYNLMQ